MNPSAPSRVSLIAITAWILTLGPVCVSAAETSTGTNAAVLQAWQAQTGQRAELDDRGVVEFRGKTGIDFYRNEVSVQAGNADTLSGLDTGTHHRLSAQFDWRHTIPDERLTYVQTGLEHTDDRGLQPRFATRVATLQTGIAGVAHRLALGDVAVNFSNLGTNQGIRGLWGDYADENWAATYYAGTVAENWEALAGRSPRMGGAANLLPLRDVMGVKVERTLTDKSGGFVTLQRYRDRKGELPQAALFSGLSTSAGLRYAGEATQAALEWAYSTQDDRQRGRSAHGDALQASVAHRVGPLALRGGYNDIDPEFRTLAQAIAPGVQEWFAGGDWTVSPQLAYSLDWRDAKTRTQVAGLVTSSTLGLLTQRLNYRFSDWPGLSLGLSHQDSRNRAAGGTNRTRTLQGTLGLTRPEWNGQLVLGQTESCAAACTEQTLWQLAGGRVVSGAAGRSLSGQAALGQTFTQAGAAPRQRQDQAGFNLGYTHERWGQWALALQWQTLSGSAGIAKLASHGYGLDWSLPAGEALSLKSYIKRQQRYRNDATRTVEENVAGIQLTYVW